MSLKWRYTTVSFAWVGLCFSIGLVLSGIIPYVMFPEEDSMFLKADIVFPDGTSFNTTSIAIKKIEKAAMKINQKYQSYGKSGILVTGVYSETGAGEGTQNQGQVYLVLVGPENRKIHSIKIVNWWREMVGEIPGTQRLTFESLGGGPGTADIQLFLSGKNLDELRDASRKIAIKLRSLAGVYDIQNDFRPGKKELLLNLKTKGKALGVTLRDLAQQLSHGFYGLEVAKLQRGRDEVKVKIRYPEHERASIANLYNTQIRVPSGEFYLLKEVAEIKEQRGIAIISRRNNARRVSIQAKVDNTITTSTIIINELYFKILPQIKNTYPGVSFSFGGANAENQKAMLSMLFGFCFAMFGIFAILALVFRSYLQPLLIMMAIPLGMIGAFIGHWIMGYSLTLLSFFGIVALAGVVVNDALVLIEKINDGQRSGLGVLESVKQAGPARFRAIILTSMTTVAGLIPLLMEQSFQAQSLKPMALSLAGGLIFATFLTLFIIPSLYLILNDLRRFVYWVFHGKWPQAEMVEPACKR